MPIFDGNPVLSAELNLMTASPQENARDVVRIAPGALLFSAHFAQLIDTSPPAACRVKFVVPYDIYVESLCVLTSRANSNAAEITVDVTGDGVMPPFAMRVKGTLNSASAVKQNRLLFDNGGVANPGVTPELTSRVLRLLPKGTTITVSVATTNTLATMEAQVVLACRQYKGREYA